MKEGALIEEGGLKMNRFTIRCAAKRARWVVPAILSVTLLLAGCTPAPESGPPAETDALGTDRAPAVDDSEQPDRAALEAALRESAAAYAADYGIKEDEAIDRLQKQQALQDILLEVEEQLGESGIVMLDTADPLCVAAELFSMADYTVIAMTEPALFHELLAKHARCIQPAVEGLSQQCPGRLWRICGPEYATEPYLPPRLFEEYVVRYTGPIVKAIQAHGGYARIHCHGRLRGVLDHIAAMGPDAIDPIEPPPQGDITLAEVRQNYGRDMVLFGNIEIADIENLDAAQFEKKVATALDEGTSGEGRGFVLLPSASPYGRTITARTMINYETMVRLVENWGG